MQQSLYHIVQELPAHFVETVKNIDDVATLNRMVDTETDVNKLQLLEARIANINFLVS